MFVYRTLAAKDCTIDELIDAVSIELSSSFSEDALKAHLSSIIVEMLESGNLRIVDGRVQIVSKAA